MTSRPSLIFQTVPPASPSGGSSSFLLKTASFAALSGGCYAVDTTSGPLSITLPASPSNGDVIQVADSQATWGTNAITLIRNGNNIEGAAFNYLDNASGDNLVLVFVGGTAGWRVFGGALKPRIIVAPSITGTASEGNVLTDANTDTWTGLPSSYTRQYQRGSGSSWTNIAGATGSSYTSVAADVGFQIRLLKTASNSNGSSVAVASAPSAVITAFSNTSLPTIVCPSPNVGQGLRDAGGDAWSATPSSTSINVQTSSNGTSGWSNISGATTSPYAIQSGDQGNYLRLAKTATLPDGSTATAYSAPTAQIGAALGLTGLIAAYTFNNTLADESGNGNDATNVNATPFVTDPAGSNMVAKFDGTGTSSITSPVVMGEGQAFTLRTPFYVVDNTRSAEYPALFITDIVNSTNMLDYILGDNRSDRNWLNLNNGGGGNLGQDQNITEGQWCDSVITYDPSVGLNWFLNGVQVLSNNTSFGDLSFNGILIGNNAIPPAGQGHVYVRDWMILNWALNQAAATALFNSGSPLNVAAATTALATL